jgi:4-hydroxybenzoate polyprenyltransferase
MRLRDVLALIRLPNVLTAPTDVAMGLAVSGAPWGGAIALLGASALAYAGGMALNDACDAPLDAVERPERPIPSGRVSRTAAFALAAVALLASLALAAAAGAHTFGVAVLLAAAIVLYDAAVKATVVGPLAMASCRALNVGLGIAVGPLVAPALPAAAVLFVYVLVLTMVSRFEVRTAPAAVVRGTALALAALLAVAALLIADTWPRHAAAGICGLVALVGWLAGPVRGALADPSPPRIIGIVKACVLGIVLLDAAFVAAAAGPARGLLVASALVPAYLLGRRFASA